MRSKHDQQLIDDWRRMAENSHAYERHLSAHLNYERARRRAAEIDAGRYAWLLWGTALVLAALLLVLLLRGGL